MDKGRGEGHKNLRTVLSLWAVVQCHSTRHYHDTLPSKRAESVLRSIARWSPWGLSCRSNMSVEAQKFNAFPRPKEYAVLPCYGHRSLLALAERQGMHGTVLASWRTLHTSGVQYAAQFASACSTECRKCLSTWRPNASSHQRSSLQSQCTGPQAYKHLAAMEPFQLKPASGAFAS
jgi:hypothetical protein